MDNKPYEYRVFTCAADDAYRIERELNEAGEEYFTLYNEIIVEPPHWAKQLAIPSSDAKTKITFILRKLKTNEETD